MPTKAAEIRDEVVNAIKPISDRPELRVTDPAFVDPVLDDAIKAGGSDRADVVWKATNAVERKLAEPEGLAQIEKLIVAHYANPPITKDGSVVTIDVGIPPGPLQVSAKHYVYVTNESPVLDNGMWIHAEAARFLRLGLAKYPDAREYDVMVVIPEPSGGGRPNWKYAYLPGQQLVKITQLGFRGVTYSVHGVGPDLGALTAISPHDMHVE